MKLSIVLPALFLAFMLSLCVYTIIETKYPGKGLAPVKNMFKEKVSFDEAIKALMEGKRIKRQSERKGYAKIIIYDGKTQKTKFGTFWVHDEDSVADYCQFSIEDVTASDWILIDS